MKLSELAKDLKPYIVPWLTEARSVTVGTGGLSAHALNGPYHTGTLAESQAPWAVTSTAFAAHTSNPDAHHAKVHSIVDGAHHTVVGSTWDIVGLSGTNVLGVLGSSSNPGVAEKILRTAADGSVTAAALISTQGGPNGGAIVQGILDADNSYARAWLGHNAQWNATTNLWTMDPIGANDAAGIFIPSSSASIDLIFHPSTGNVARTMDHATFTGGKKFSFASNGAMSGSSVFSSGFTGAGYRLDDGVATAGKTTLELDEMIVRGRMRVYELLIHQIRATNGSVFVSGVGKAKTVSGSGPYTITTDTDHGFAANDLIRAQRFTGSGVYQSNLTVTSVASSTQFTATLSSGDAPAAGMEFVRLGNTTDTTRQGSIYLTADDTFAPAIDILDGVASFAQWGSASKIKVRLGKLDTTLDANLLPSGYGLYAPNAYLSGDLLTGGGNIRIYNASGINLKEDVWGSWDDKRALQWWADITNMTGNPSLSIYTGKTVGGLTNNQNFSHIDAKATGGQLAGLSLTAFGQGTGTAATIYLEGGSQALSSLASVTVTASSIDLVGTLLVDGTTSARQINPQSDTGYNLGTALLRWGTLYVNQVVANSVNNVSAIGIGYATPGATWTTSGWVKSIEFANQGTAIVWRKAASGVARGIGVTSNGILYFARSTASDSSAAATYDAYIDNNGTLSINQTANVGLYINSGVASAAVYVSSYNAGSTYGPHVVIGRNTNASTPASGFVQLVGRNGSAYNIWPDNSGNLRIGTTAPNSANDTSGTVVGTQTSSLDSKNIIEPFTDYGSALNAIVDAPLFDFFYKNKAFGGQRFTGIVTDYAPVFGMDRDEAHPAGKSLNEITAHGYTFAAIKALHARIEELENQVRMLTKIKPA